MNWPNMMCRGTMDASAFVTKEQWEDILAKNLCDEVDIR
jgi:hypothetical protein